MKKAQNAAPTQGEEQLFKQDDSPAASEPSSDRPKRGTGQKRRPRGNRARGENAPAREQQAQEAPQQQPQQKPQRQRQQQPPQQQQSQEARDGRDGDRSGGRDRRRDDRRGDGRNPKGFQGRNKGRNRPNRGNGRNRGDRGERAERAEGGVAVGPAPANAVTLRGILEHRKDGAAFLRRVNDEEGQQTGDVFVGGGLRPGDLRPGVEVEVEAVPGTGKAQFTARRILTVDNEPPENARNVPPLFERGTVIDPHEYLRLETGAEPIGTRIVDLFCPIGKGTRGMIVAPPRSGKTILLKQIASAITENHPECKLMILLIDERPEEVTDFRRTIPGAEVWASSNDEPLQSHIDNARLAINRAKRLVEKGQDVVILLDSITRLARAFNASGEGARGRTMTGGVAAGAMQEPRAMFGASRCFEEGGSLTMIATALVETGSAMDELIFQEFKGTGNMELVLDRKLAEKRLFPAIDIAASGTRKDEKLLEPGTHKRVSLIRRYLSGMDMVTGMGKLIDAMEKTKSNTDLLKLFEP